MSLKDYHWASVVHLTEIIWSINVVKGLRDPSCTFLSASRLISASLSNPQPKGHLLLQFSFKLRDSQKQSGQGGVGVVWGERVRVYEPMLGLILEVPYALILHWGLMLFSLLPISDWFY